MDISNILTVDLEDWYQVHSLRHIVNFQDWDKYEDRVEIGANKLLSILNEYNTKATFFVLGWVAEKYPELIRSIHSEGHEIASHGYAHKLIYEQGPKEFEKDLKRSIEILETITSKKVEGYRAPSWSIVRETLWALDVLAENGIKYDSSIYPTANYQFGLPDANRYPGIIDTPSGHKLLEIPPSICKFLRKSVPVAGGFPLRAYPYWFTKYQIKKLNKDNLRAVVYLHPWELDTAHPKIKLPLKNRIIHYFRLGKMETNIRNLLNSFRFASIESIFLRKENV